MIIDRRYIFAIVAIIVLIPLLFPIGIPILITDDTRAVYAHINALAPGAVVMVSFDHEASSLPEVRPLAEAVVTHCFSRGLRVVGLALFAEGTAIGDEVLRSAAGRRGKIYGVDYVYLGYRPQYSAAILGMGESIKQVFPTDYSGTRYDDIAMLTGIRNYHDMAVVISIADGSLPTYWVEYAHTRYGARIIAVLAASMVTAYKPNLKAHQLEGILGGLKGAAEYEKLLGYAGPATRAMDAQSMAHLTIAVLIVVGNMLSWVRRSGRKNASGG